MPIPSYSFEKFNYTLRPSKQVERRMMIEVLHRLTKCGCDIPTYTYLGFGSVYYADFTMFHKHLYIDEMICVEWGDIPKRMRFNKPFKFIKLHMEPLANFLPRLRRNRRYLVWLDYDRALDESLLRDIDGCVSRLAPGSVFVVTVEARPRINEEEVEIEAMAGPQRERYIVGRYKEWFGSLVRMTINRDSIAPNHIALLFQGAIAGQIEMSLSHRKDIQFIQLFNYVYADGAPMLTVGGVISDPACANNIKSSDVLEHDFVRQEPEPLLVSVPHLTLREKQWLDSKLEAKSVSCQLAFELDDEFLKNYAKYYKEYPTFMEAML
jgi:hypothetical protein